VFHRLEAVPGCCDGLTNADIRNLLLTAFPSPWSPTVIYFFFAYILEVDRLTWLSMSPGNVLKNGSSARNSSSVTVCFFVFMLVTVKPTASVSKLKIGRGRWPGRIGGYRSFPTSLSLTNAFFNQMGGAKGR
jgi:hypothetical protein